MYDLINQFADTLVKTIQPEHVTNYEWLLQNFYFFQEPSTGATLQQRIESLMAFHSFLAEEYARVLKGGLLATAIQEFRLRLKPQRFTDEKIIDSLVWAFVALLRKGALPKGKIVYG